MPDANTDEEESAERAEEGQALRPASPSDAQDQAEDRPRSGELKQGQALLGQLGRGGGRSQPEAADDA